MGRLLLAVLTVSLALAGPASAAPGSVGGGTSAVGDALGAKLPRPPRPYFGPRPKPHTEPPIPRSKR